MSMNFDTLFGPYQDTKKFTINYNWIDVDSATGFVSYDGFELYISSGAGYYLENSEERTNFISWANYTASAGGDYHNNTKVLDIDFDTAAFKKSRIIRGRGYFRIPVSVSMADVADMDVATYVIVKVRKWDGSTETEIASVQSATVTMYLRHSPANLIDSFLFLPYIEIPNTTLNIDEKLRITVEVYIDSTTANVCGATLHHDPQGSALYDLVAGYTRLMGIIPFFIDSGE